MERIRYSLEISIDVPNFFTNPTFYFKKAGVAGSSITIATFAYFLTNYAEKRAEDQRIQKQKKKKQMQEDARSAGLVDMEAVY